MSLKAELETWAAALTAYDENDYDKALELFSVRGLGSIHPRMSSDARIHRKSQTRRKS